MSEEGRRNNPGRLDTNTCQTAIYDALRVIVRPSHNYRPVHYPLQGIKWICIKCGEFKRD